MGECCVSICPKETVKKENEIKHNKTVKSAIAGAKCWGMELYYTLKEFLAIPIVYIIGILSITRNISSAKSWLQLRIWVKNQYSFENNHKRSVPFLPFTTCVTLVILFDFTKSRVSHLKKGKITHLIGQLQDVYEIHLRIKGDAYIYSHIPIKTVKYMKLASIHTSYYHM